MLFIRNDDRSHNPGEQMDLDDFMKGAEALCGALIAGEDTGEAVRLGLALEVSRFPDVGRAAPCRWRQGG
jgi:hypothetical protein